MENFSFATVTDDAYLDQAAGLVLNVSQIHSGINTVVCFLEETGYHAFKPLEKYGAVRVLASDVWGEEAWRNLKLRYSRPEIAFSTCAAISDWVLDNYAEHVVYLDNDILLLEKIDELMCKLEKYAAVLVPFGRILDHLKRSPYSGLFCTGTIGFSNRGKEYANYWKKLCFTECRELIEDGLYWDQKYLDIFACQSGVYVLPDPGMQVLGNHMQYHKPFQDEEGVWRIQQENAKIKIFHMARGTARDFPLSKQKLQLNEQGFQLLMLETRKAKLLSSAKESSLNVGSLFLKIRNINKKIYIQILHTLYDLRRIIELKEGTIFERIKALKRKGEILKTWQTKKRNN